MTYSRKEFLKSVGLAAAATSLFNSNPSQASPNTSSKTQKKEYFHFGVASYTLREFNLDDALALAKRAGLKNICLKSNHMPLNASAEEIQSIVGKVKEAGLTLYTAGVIYMKTESEVNQAFEYAKTAGLPMITGVPMPELLSLVDKKVKEYNIKVAIHNHGPEDKVYPTAASAYEKIKNLDKRIGLCMDIGHEARMPQDPAEQVLKYADRLFDMHLKDVTGPVKDAKAVEIGRGIIDFGKLLKAMMKIKFAGVASLEIEKDEKDPLPAIAESVGYLRGVESVI